MEFVQIFVHYILVCLRMNNSDIKIAILFSGHTKQWKKSIDSFYTNLYNILIDNNFQVKNYLFSFLEQFPYKSSSMFNKGVQANNEQELIKEFKLTRCKLEKYDHTKFDIQNFYNGKLTLDEQLTNNNGVEVKSLNKYRSNNTIYAIPMLYQNKEVFKLLNEEFHVVIRLRPDIILHHSFPINMIYKCIMEPNLLAAGMESVNIKRWFAIDDKFAMGSMHAMHKYCSAFDYLYLILNKYNIFWPPEAVLGKSLHINQLEHFDFPQYIQVAY